MGNQQSNSSTTSANTNTNTNTIVETKELEKDFIGLEIVPLESAIVAVDDDDDHDDDDDDHPDSDSDSDFDSYDGDDEIETETDTTSTAPQQSKCQETDMDMDMDMVMVMEAVVNDDDADSDLDVTDDEEDDEDDYHYDEERYMILEDAVALKALAVAYLHPELPISCDGASFARCYYHRPAAMEQESVEDAEERHQILEDAAALKTLAVAYLHPELPVLSSNATSFARCYYHRPSAMEQESVEDSEERHQILEDAAALKTLAVAYLHPELPVISSDATAFARCYYDRPSAMEQESVEDAEERHRILEDAVALKTLAVAYLHPEIPVLSSDATSFARCYYDRPSAMEQESVEDAEERHRILEDAAALKTLAVAYLHPELPVNSSYATSFARCYFGRPSAMEQESVEDAEERHRILEDAVALKTLAVAYLHPELPVNSSYATAFARCYYDRPSAMEQESVEDAEERHRILEDAASLKTLAVAYLHPELPVNSSYAASFARCYFDRPSAMEQESVEDAEERRMIFEDVSKLKKLSLNSSYQGAKAVHVPSNKTVSNNNNNPVDIGFFVKVRSPSAVHLHGLGEECCTTTTTTAADGTRSGEDDSYVVSTLF